MPRSCDLQSCFIKPSRFLIVPGSSFPGEIFTPLLRCCHGHRMSAAFSGDVVLHLRPLRWHKATMKQHMAENHSKVEWLSIGDVVSQLRKRKIYQVPKEVNSCVNTVRYLEPLKVVSFCHPWGIVAFVASRQR